MGSADAANWVWHHHTYWRIVFIVWRQSENPALINSAINCCSAGLGDSDVWEVRTLTRNPTAHKKPTPSTESLKGVGWVCFSGSGVVSVSRHAERDLWCEIISYSEVWSPFRANQHLSHFLRNTSNCAWSHSLEIFSVLCCCPKPKSPSITRGVSCRVQNRDVPWNNHRGSCQPWGK